MPSVLVGASRIEQIDSVGRAVSRAENQAAGSSGVSRLAVTTRFRPLLFAW